MTPKYSAAPVVGSELENVSITVFASYNEPDGKRHDLTWRQLVDLVRKPFAKPTKKTELRLWSGSIFAGDYRDEEHFEGADLLTFDVDEAPVPSEDTIRRVPFAGLFHSTTSHTERAPRWRLVLRLSRRVRTAAEYRRVWRGVEKALEKALGFRVGQAAKDPPRQCFVWAEPIHGPYVFGELVGAPVDVDAILTSTPEDESDHTAPIDLDPELHAIGRDAIEAAARALAPSFAPGERDKLGFAIAGVCARARVSREDAIALLSLVAELGPCGNVDELKRRRTIEKAYADLEKGTAPVPGWPKLRSLVGEPVTDLVRTCLGSSAAFDGMEGIELDAEPANDTIASDPCLSALRVRRDEDDRLSLVERVGTLTTEAWHFTRGDAVEIAQRLIEAIKPHHQIVFTEGAFYAYDRARGVWGSEDVESALRRAIHSMAGATLPGATRVSKLTGEVTQTQSCLKLKAHDVRGALETLAHMTADESFFASTVDGLACPNGFLRLTDEGVELRPHAPEHRARTAYPIGYDPDARSDRWNAFLADLFRDDEDKAEKIALLGEFFGGALFGLSTTYQKCIAAPGEGSNGKSALLSIIDDVFPPGTIAAFSPQKLENEYWRSKLPGVLLNAVSELPSAAILASESFKAIVTGDRIDAREPTKPVISFRPKAGHFFGGQNLPSTTDHSHGFWRRFIVLGFNRTFGADADRHIAKKILAECRPAILAWLVEGAVRLRCQDEYTTPASHEGLLKGWRKNSDSVALWFEERVQVDPNAKTTARDLYAAYNAWARAGNLKPVAINTWGARLRKLGFEREGKEKTYALAVPSGDVPLFLR